MMPKQGEQRRKPEPVTFANCSGLRGDEISHSPGRGGACYPSDESRCPYLGNISRSWQLQGPSIISREKEAPPESNFQPGTVSRVGRVSLPQSDQPGLGEWNETASAPAPLCWVLLIKEGRTVWAPSCRALRRPWRKGLGHLAEACFQRGVLQDPFLSGLQPSDLHVHFPISHNSLEIKSSSSRQWCRKQPHVFYTLSKAK